MTHKILIYGIAALVFFGGCKKGNEKKEAANIHIDNPAIRLTYLYTGRDIGMDPLELPAPHVLKQAVSADGIHFGDVKTLLEYGQFVDPDIFKRGSGVYCVLLTTFPTVTNPKLVLATSSTVDGTYTIAGEVENGGVGQTGTIVYNGTAKTYFGTSAADFSTTQRKLLNPKQAVNVTGIDMSSGGGITDPSVAKMADGKYIMVFVYAKVGDPPSAKKVYTIISSDPTNFSGQAKLLHERATTPTVTRVGSKVYVYYGGDNGMAVCISNDNGNTWTFSDATLNGQKFDTGVDPTALPVDETNLD